jgi:DNA-binding transcriptional MerR regulator/GGDEF domain-containing protein
MEERNPQSIEALRAYLQQDDVQARIQQSITNSRDGATVSIGRMAQLFHMKEAKIRELDARRLLKPSRTKESSTGQRQYAPAELEKLAIINDLLTQGRFSVYEIPENIDELWKSLVPNNGRAGTARENSEARNEFHREADDLPIDKRVNHFYYKEFFWRYYASHALQLSAKLISEEFHLARVGLILPLHQKQAYMLVHQASDLYKAGESLVGWLGQTGSFYTILAARPAFEFPTDFSIFPLQASDEDKPEDDTLIVIPRLDLESNAISFSSPIVETIRRLLEPLYSDVADWNFYFGKGMRDKIDPLFDFSTNPKARDTILTGLANMIERLGGIGQHRWKFCCILTPNQPHLPFQKRDLVVRAKSRHAPSLYKLGETKVSATDSAVMSLSLRAYQAGRIMYHHKITPTDSTIINREVEDPASAIAIPVGGEDGIPVGVIYVVANVPDSFNESDQRVLRVAARMVQELLLSYHLRQQVSQTFAPLLSNPGVVDPTFGKFASEVDFIVDLEKLLGDIQNKEKFESYAKSDERQYTTKEAVSFLAVDIDGQTSLTDKYGERMARNMSREVGLRIQAQLPAIFPSKPDLKVYHIYADRFYILLDGISLNEARDKAATLKQALNGSYSIDMVRSSEQTTPKENFIPSPEVTVRLGVGSYTYAKLQDLLSRHPKSMSLSATSTTIIDFHDTMLKYGQNIGGNVIVSWDYKSWRYEVWTPPSDTKLAT